MCHGTWLREYYVYLRKLELCRYLRDEPNVKSSDAVAAEMH
jgi:hypothetical protein